MVQWDVAVQVQGPLSNSCFIKFSFLFFLDRNWNVYLLNSVIEAHIHNNFSFAEICSSGISMLRTHGPIVWLQKPTQISIKSNYQQIMLKLFNCQHTTKLKTIGISFQHHDQYNLDTKPIIVDAQAVRKSLHLKRPCKIQRIFLVKNINTSFERNHWTWIDCVFQAA